MTSAPRALSASALLLALGVLAHAPAAGQEPYPLPPPGTEVADTVALDTMRREVALVLSGGGSRGLAHVGVLIGLQRLGHDPDIVAGSSMGAMVGALYAAGYPPEEIRKRIEEVSWGEMFTPAPMVLGPGGEVRYPLLSVDWSDDPLRFSRGFIPQWRINRALARLLFDANARARGSFDRLARRYRAVATDLKTGEAVVLAEGDLARAVRASMAVPGVFAPVEWEGRSLVDGGIADNLPTAAVRELGAERVIAADVSRPPDEIQGRKPLQVLGRALDLLQENARRHEVPPEVLILPDIPPDLQGVTFPGDPEPLFQLGLTAALRDAGRVEGNGPAPRPLPAPPRALGELRIEAPDPALESLARRILAGVAPGPYDPARVLVAVDRLYATGLFEAVWPRLEEEDGDAPPALVVRLEAPPRTTLSGALGYDTDVGGRAWGAMQRSAVALRAPTLLTAAASADRVEQWGALSARVFLPPWRHTVWSGGVYFREVDVRRFDLEAVATDQEVRRAGGWLGLEFQHALAARMALAALRVERLAVEDGGHGLSLGPLLRIAAQAPAVPVVGTPLELEAEVRWGAFPYRRVEVRGSRELRLGRLRLAAVVDVAAASRQAPPDAHSALGDRHAVPGFRWGEIRAPARAIAGVDAAYPMPYGGFARVRTRVAAVADRVHDLDADSPVSGVELGALWRTPFGALSAAWGLNSRGEGRLILGVGPYF